MFVGSQYTTVFEKIEVDMGKSICHLNISVLPLVNMVGDCCIFVLLHVVLFLINGYHKQVVQAHTGDLIETIGVSCLLKVSKFVLRGFVGDAVSCIIGLLCVCNHQ